MPAQCRGAAEAAERPRRPRRRSGTILARSASCGCQIWHRVPAAVPVVPAGAKEAAEAAEVAAEVLEAREDPRSDEKLQ